jgi:hypothetical protein
MTLAVLSKQDLDDVAGGGGFKFVYNPQQNVQGAQIAVWGDNAVAQTNNSGVIAFSNTGFVSFWH